MRPYTKELEYWVYDVADETKTFQDRFMYSNIESDGLIRRVHTLIIYDVGGLKLLHDVDVANGFEGEMVRNLLGMYVFNYRSNDLQKYKEFEEEEFEIVGAKCATGTQEGCVIWTCVTKEGREFDAVPKGTLPDRQYKYINREKYFGKLLTVRYSELSEDNIPIGNPVGGIEPHGEAIRDYE
jgi:DNA ligase-1